MQHSYNTPKTTSTRLQIENIYNTPRAQRQCNYNTPTAQLQCTENSYVSTAHLKKAFTLRRAHNTMPKPRHMFGTNCLIFSATLSQATVAQTCTSARENVRVCLHCVCNMESEGILPQLAQLLGSVPPPVNWRAVGCRGNP